MKRLLLVAALCTSFLAAETVKRADARTLEAMVRFLASDALEGRDTPSKGLDIAAEYIAMEFRKIGLEPLPGGSYFQTATMRSLTPVREGARLELRAGDRTVSMPVEKTLWSPGPAVDLDWTEARRLTLAEAKAVTAPLGSPVAVLGGGTLNRETMQTVRKLGEAGVKLVILVGIPAPVGAKQMLFDDQPMPGLVVLRTNDEEAGKLLQQGGSLSVSAKLPAAKLETAEARNVIGILPGRDSALRKEYVMLSAHYDHLGLNVRATEGDRIFNGANDDASGVASMIESARLITALKKRPRRSVAFVAWFGEEKGLLGSQYFGRKPVLPLADLVANLNLEQTGRTDASGGEKNVGMANLTGYGFTGIAGFMEAAGAATGLKIVKNEKFSDAFFMASDNAALAAVGVPSTTLSVTYQFPDYHQVGDEWQKIDYPNMANVTRTVAEGTRRMADAATRVGWNEREDKVKAYVEAARKLKATRP